jgi:hydroxymethylbilane synthase
MHSLKDAPMAMPGDFRLAAIMARDDPRDALVSNAHASLGALAPGRVVDASSLRREAQLRERNPQLVVKPLHGNVNTRLHHLDQGNHAAIILAGAGLKRLGFAARITALLEAEYSLPAIGQGALAVECCADRDDEATALKPLADADASFATTAERAFCCKLAASCRTSLAAYAVWRGGGPWARGLIARRDGRRVLRGERAMAVADSDDAAVLRAALGNEFLERGAAAILAEVS